MSGPLRDNWTFPFTAKDMVDHATQRIGELSAVLDRHVDEEAFKQQYVTEQREKLRAAGVKNWEHVAIDPPNSHTYRNSEQGYRYERSRLVKDVIELRHWVLWFEHACSMDASRTFKLTKDDMEFFGIGAAL